MLSFSAFKKGATVTEQTDRDHDRSPLRPTETGIDSSSDSSGKSPTFNASVDVPPAAQSVVTVEPLCPPTGSLDRRLLSTLQREYCPTASEYTKEQAEEEIKATLEWENLLKCGSDFERIASGEQLEYDHLLLDHRVAIKVYNTAIEDHSMDDTRIGELHQAVTAISTAITSFEEAHQVLDPEISFSRPD